GELTQKIKANTDSNFVQEVIEAMTINESLFFRDIKPFNELSSNILPALMEANPNRKIRIWSAACSTGQEPYSIVMTIKDHPELASLDFIIDASDINHAVIDKASNGVYSQFEVQRGVPTVMLMKYFKQGESSEDWKINDEIRQYVRYLHMNLVSDMVQVNTYDIVFCRNVLIYFDTDTKIQVLKKMHASLATDGILILGSAEHINGLVDGIFKKHGQCPGIYIKN
ncbi:MAG: protein-glutamate O-methyltransferase CheR, partial [Rickettsiales bacterium]|nr:protein-glutamate O-methyltransferase CheR [Rickettsiales bacterium]